MAARSADLLSDHRPLTKSEHEDEDEEDDRRDSVDSRLSRNTDRIDPLKEFNDLSSDEDEEAEEDEEGDEGEHAAGKVERRLITDRKDQDMYHVESVIVVGVEGGDTAGGTSMEMSDMAALKPIPAPLRRLKSILRKSGDKGRKLKVSWGDEMGLPLARQSSVPRSWDRTPVLSEALQRRLDERRRKRELIVAYGCGLMICVMLLLVSLVTVAIKLYLSANS